MAFLPPVVGSEQESLKVQGRALANYQICTEVAQSMGDLVMASYYAAMFDDSLVAIEKTSKKDSIIIFDEFQRSLDKLSEFAKQSMGKLCLSRFDPLARKIHKDKLLINK